jgi:cytoskeletal protein CcmA (bactofilin family)
MSGPDKQPSGVDANESLRERADEIELTDLVSDLDQSFGTWLFSFETSTKGIPRENLFEGTLSLGGFFAGTIRSEEGTLTITSTGEINGDIAAKNIIVEGLVRGDISATSKVELTSTARVIGDIETAALEIQPGAIFEGRCSFLIKPRTKGTPGLRSSSSRSRKTKAKPFAPDALAAAS